MQQRAKYAMFVLSAAVLAGAWLLAENIDGAEEAAAMTAESPAPEELSLSVGPAEALTALSWSYDGQTVNLVREEGGRWVSADDEACPIDGAAAEALAEAASGAAASMAITDAADLAQYGLDAPALTVVAATRERVAAYEVGNMTITGEYYTRMDGESTVFLENGSLAAFRVGLADILALETLPEDVSAVTALSVSSEAGSYTLRYREGGEPGWFRTDGGEPEPLDGERVRALYEALMGTELTDCVTWRAEEPADYGLDEPQAAAELRYIDTAGQKGSFTLEFGAYEGSDVYVRLAGSGMVYLTPAYVPDALMYPRWEEMTPASVITFDPASVAEVHIELDGRTYDILRLEETTERAVGEETVAVTDVIYSSNGWVLDTDGMDAWLRSLSSLTADSVTPAGEGRQTKLTVRLTWLDAESVPAELELRSYDSAHALCVVGGDRLLLVPRSEAEALLAGAESMLGGE